MVIRTAAARGAAPRDVTLPCVPESVTRGRQLLAADLYAAGAPTGLVDDASIVVSELIGNAVAHASPLPDDGIHLRWSTAHNRVEIAVTDGGSPDRPTVQRPSLTEIGGRGLVLVEALANGWGVEEGQDRTTVWAVLRR